MKFRFEVGARVVPREIENAMVGTVVDRMSQRVDARRTNFYLIAFETSRGGLFTSAPEDILVRKTDG